LQRCLAVSVWYVCCWPGATVRCTQKNKKKELHDMVILGIIVLLMGGYLVYALTHPERF
jgi:K+-transporting ATPase KdpF subunit